MKKILLFGVVSISLGLGAFNFSSSVEKFTDLTLQNIEALASSGETGGCTASLSCSMTSDNDFVSCTGKSCSRNPVERWVECDGTKTSCTTVTTK